MKKIIILLLIIASAIIIYFNVKSVNNDKKTIKVAEVTHSIFYTPLYVALENGYFKDEGLDVELILASGADKVSAAVLSGDVQIGLAGAESAIYVYTGNEKDYLQIFSGLTKRDGQFIVGRKQEKDFSLSSLVGKEILVGRKGGMPALNFLNALKNSGIDENKININYSIDFASLSGAFIGGSGEYVNLFEPNASLIESQNNGYILTSIGMLSGEMPYTAFYARKSYIKNNKETIKKYVNAISKGLNYVNNHDSKDIAKIIKNQFKDNTLNELEIMIDNYKKADSWLTNTHITEESFRNLENVMIDNGLLDDYVSFNDLVINYE